MIAHRTNTRIRGGGSNGYDERTPSSVNSNRGTHPPYVKFISNAMHNVFSNQRLNDCFDSFHFSRQRPTLKPSGAIVSKATEFVDIYRNPPSRPDPLYPQPTPDKTAAKCRKDVCLLPDCSCGGRDIPGNFTIHSFLQTNF